MYRVNVEFSSLKEGHLFKAGGTLWAKQSSKTARIIRGPSIAPNHPFYFKQKDRVWITRRVFKVIKGE